MLLNDEEINQLCLTSNLPFRYFQPLEQVQSCFLEKPYLLFLLFSASLALQPYFVQK